MGKGLVRALSVVVSHKQAMGAAEHEVVEVEKRSLEMCPF
jgi:hypothetical protein